jgi:hypothetical protein
MSTSTGELTRVRQRPRATPYLVLAFTLVIAAFGAFPYNLLFLVPLAASLTLAGIPRWVRTVVALGSVVALVAGAAVAIN